MKVKLLGTALNILSSLMMYVDYSNNTIMFRRLLSGQKRSLNFLETGFKKFLLSVSFSQISKDTCI